MPEEGVDLTPNEDLMTTDEIMRLVIFLSALIVVGKVGKGHSAYHHTWQSGRPLGARNTSISTPRSLMACDRPLDRLRFRGGLGCWKHLML